MPDKLPTSGIQRTEQEFLKCISLSSAPAIRFCRSSPECSPACSCRTSLGKTGSLSSSIPLCSLPFRSPIKPWRFRIRIESAPPAPAVGVGPTVLAVCHTPLVVLGGRRIKPEHLPPPARLSELDQSLAPKALAKPLSLSRLGGAHHTAHPWLFHRARNSPVPRLPLLASTGLFHCLVDQPPGHFSLFVAQPVNTARNPAVVRSRRPAS